jgi:16S rRNA (guanine527-N7)-methyltransferase
VTDPGLPKHRKSIAVNDDRKRRQAPDSHRLREIGERYGLSSEAVVRLDLLTGRLANDPFAPTALRGRSEILDDHLADSLVGLEISEMRAAETIADLGAGAGFPGLPLAIARPEAKVALVESNGRKCAYIARAAQACRIDNATVVHARAEAWPEGLERFDLIIARALAPLAVVAEYAAPLLRTGGALLVWRGRRDSEDEAAGARAASQLGLEPREPQAVHPYAGALHRHLQLMLKVSQTPAGFPRRPGLARKRPLGAPC